MIRPDFEQGVKRKKIEAINGKEKNRKRNSIPRIIFTAGIQWKRKNDDYMWNIKGSEKSRS